MIRFPRPVPPMYSRASLGFKGSSLLSRDVRLTRKIFPVYPFMDPFSFLRKDGGRWNGRGMHFLLINFSGKVKSFLFQKKINAEEEEEGADSKKNPSPLDDFPAVHFQNGVLQDGVNMDIALHSAFGVNLVGVLAEGDMHGAIAACVVQHATGMLQVVVSPAGDFGHIVGVLDALNDGAQFRRFFPPLHLA